MTASQDFGAVARLGTPEVRAMKSFPES